MNLADFDFDLPKSLIAQKPASPRNQARLMIYDRSTKEITDSHFYDLRKYLIHGSTLVLNNSKVEKCRFRFDSVEVFVLETLNSTTIKALVKPGKKFRQDGEIELGGVLFKTIDIEEDGVRTIQLSAPIDSKNLDKFRLTPFPPYIEQNEKLASEYQTVYARPLGSKASPTAGLHFTKQQLDELASYHPVAEVTLHVGLGTFGKLTTNQINSGKLHTENFMISSRSANLLNSAKHITAVGTTSARVLESLGRPFTETASQTDIFITPGYKFKAVDSLITNFHLPGTSLLMLVAAFIGSTDEMQHIYRHAITNEYRFYSFGDAMLIV